ATTKEICEYSKTNTESKLHSTGFCKRVGILPEAAGTVKYGVLNAAVCSVKSDGIRRIEYLPAEVESGLFGKLPGFTQSEVDTEISGSTDVVAAATFTGMWKTPVSGNKVTLTKVRAERRVRRQASKHVGIAITIAEDPGFGGRAN